MILEYGKNIFIESDILQQLAKQSGKVAVHIKAVGILELDDKEKEDEVWEFYFGKCPEQILSILMQFKEVYCFLETNEQAIHAFEEWFPPKSYLLPEEMHFYVRMEMISPDGSISAVND